jgi:hypothetical protein
MSHAIAETSLYGSANAFDAAHVPTRHLEADGAMLSSDEAGASGIAGVWLLFYALTVLVVVIAN